MPDNFSDHEENAAQAEPTGTEPGIYERVDSDLNVLRADLAVIKGMAARAVTCMKSGRVLDWKTTVVVDITHPTKPGHKATLVYDAGAFEQMSKVDGTFPQLAAGGYRIEISDARELLRAARRVAKLEAKERSNGD